MLKSKLCPRLIFADAEANASLPQNCCGSGFRLQHVFLAEDFSSPPEGGATLISLALRPDGTAVTGPQAKLLSETTMVFSTTDSGVNSGLSRTFSDKRGFDFTTVKTDDFTLTTDNLGPIGGPKVFDYIVEFDKPFFYDPDEGNLLWEWSGISEASLLHDFSNDGANQIVFGGRDDLTGTYFGSFVVEFNFVPKPSSGWLSIIATLAMVSCFRIRRLRHAQGGLSRMLAAGR